jgi:lysophospholipase L1-like esterase
MKLSLKQISPFVRGCGNLEEVDGEIFFDRIGAAGRAYYDLSPASHLRARCPAGVMIEMRTDATAVDIHLRLGGGARTYATVDAVVENALVASMTNQQVHGDWQDRLVLPASEYARRLQIYFPHSAAANLVSIDLIDAQLVEPITPSKTLMTFGDSITQGMDAVHPSLTYVAVAARELRMDLYNYGIGGAVFARESLPVVPIARPDLITIAYGTNDFSDGRPVEMARDYLLQIRTMFPNTPLAVLMPLWRTKGDHDGWCNSSGMSLARYRDSIRSIAQDLNLPWIAHDWLLPAVASLHVDGLHPSDAGHQIVGMNLANRLIAMFEGHEKSYAGLHTSPANFNIGMQRPGAEKPG